MPSKDVEALAELARLCSVARAGLPETGFHRLRVLLDMILVDLAREGVCAGAEVDAGTERKPDSSRSQEAP